MAERRRTVVFDDFSKGEFGALGSWNAPKGSFTGQNVVRYVDGSLGPRNGLKALTVTGLPANPLGGALGLNGNGDLWFQIGTLIKTIDMTSTAAQAATAIGDAGVNVEDAVYLNPYVYAVTVGSGIKRLDFSTPAVTAVASSPNGSIIRQYGERTLVAGDGSQPQRLYYSAAGDPESWPAGNFLEVGKGTTIKAVVALRGGMAIYTIASSFTGVDGRWWLLTGVPGVNEVLREVLRGSDGPNGSLDAAISGDGLVVFAASHAETIGLFDGTQVRLLRHLLLGTPAAIDVRSVVPLREEDDVLLVAYASATASSGVGHHRRQGAWLKHAFDEADVLHKITTRDGVLPSGAADVTRAQNLVLFATAASPPVFYIWSAYNDRPPFSADYGAAVPTASGVHFTLPDIEASAGEQLSVRKVTVWFRDWNTGSSNNQFSVNVTPIRQYEAGDGTAQTKSFSRIVGESSVSGSNLRVEWGFAEDFGDAARIKVSDMRGVAIHRIEVSIDTKPDLT